MAERSPLLVRVTRSDATAFVNLARRFETSPRELGRQALQLMLVAAKGGATLAVPPLDPAQACHSIKLWPSEEMAAELDDLAAAEGCDTAELGERAVRYLLEQAKAGALPMIAGAWEPETGLRTEEERQNTLAGHNFVKARMHVDRALRAAAAPFDPEHPTAHIEMLRFMDDMHNFKPD